MPNLDKVVKSLTVEQKTLQSKLHQVEAAITALRGMGSNGRMAGARPKRVLSVAARRRIAAAQRARWAKWKQSKKAAA
jgi:hypothetical protein